MPNNRKALLSDGSKASSSHEHVIKKFASLTASRNVDVIKAVIKDKYGFDCSNKYAADLIAFVEALTDGQ